MYTLYSCHDFSVGLSLISFIKTLKNILAKIDKYIAQCHSYENAPKKYTTATFSFAVFTQPYNFTKRLLIKYTVLSV